MKDIGRNDVCFCGSGLKYKKCHIKEEEILKKFKNEGYKIPNNIYRKTEEEILKIKKAGDVNKEILDYIENNIKAGMTTLEIDKIVDTMTRERNGIPAPLNYEGYPKSVCTSINNCICHGIPSDRVINDGDIINVDITTILDGYYADSSRTFLIGNVSETAKKLVETAKICLEKAIEGIKGYMPLNSIGKIIEPIAEENGFSVVKDFGGHGIGRKFHEPPHVDHFYNKDNKILLLPNMVLTIEPMINEGTCNCNIQADKWTTLTADGKLSAQFEHTVVVRENGLEILT